MAVSYSPYVALTDLTADHLKSKYLTGFSFLGDDGQPLPNSWFEHHIGNAIARLEEETDVDILARVTEGEKHDYNANDYAVFAFMKLFRTPARSVEAVRAVHPSGQTIQLFPNEWVRLETHGAHIHLIPTSGTLATVLIGQGIDYLPFFSGLGYVPHMWEVDYTSGFDPTKIPRPIADAICKLACVELLTVMSDAVTPIGLTSMSQGVDGLSQSKSFDKPAFRSRIEAYSKELGLPGYGTEETGMIHHIRNQYFGILLAAV